MDAYVEKAATLLDRAGWRLQPYVAELAGGCKPMWRCWPTHGVGLGVLQIDLAAQDLVSMATVSTTIASLAIVRVASKCMAIVRGAPAPQADRCSTATRGPPRLRLRRRRLRRRLRLRRQLRLRLRRWDFWLSACRRARRRAQSSRCPASPAHEHICTRAVSTLMSCVLAVATCDNGALGEPPSNPPYDTALQPYPKTTLP